MNPVGLILVAAGMFSVLGGALDWDFFMNSRRAQLFVSLLGRNGARVVYIVLGVLISAVGAAVTLGILKR